MPLDPLLDPLLEPLLLDTAPDLDDTPDLDTVDLILPVLPDPLEVPRSSLLGILLGTLLFSILLLADTLSYLE